MGGRDGPKGGWEGERGERGEGGGLGGALIVMNGLVLRPLALASLERRDGARRVRRGSGRARRREGEGRVAAFFGYNTWHYCSIILLVH